MGHLIGRAGQRSRETYPTPQFAPVIPLALPTQVVFAESTGDTQTAVKRVDGGAALLLQDAGAPMELACPVLASARKVLVTMTGSVTQIASGQGEFAFWWPVMTGSVSGVVTGGYEGGYVQGNAVTRPVEGQWVFDLVSGESGVVSFMWGCSFGVDAVQVRPGDANEPTRFKVSALVVPV